MYIYCAAIYGYQTEGGRSFVAVTISKMATSERDVILITDNQVKMYYL